MSTHNKHERAERGAAEIFAGVGVGLFCLAVFVQQIIPIPPGSPAPQIASQLNATAGLAFVLAVYVACVGARRLTKHGE